MNFVKEYLKNLWANEPVKAALYPLLAALVGYLLVKAGVDANLEDLILGLVAAALGVPGVKALRSAVSPVPLAERKFGKR